MLNVSIHKYKLNIKHGTLYLDSLAFTSQEVHEFLPGVERVEYTTIVACCRDAVLLFHTSHLHAHMLGFYDYHHALRFEGFLYAVLDLLCEALLHLKTMAVDVHHAGYLAQSCDVSVGDVCHVSLAIEWQHVVFAHREEVDVLDDDHLVVFLGKECVVRTL